MIADPESRAQAMQIGARPLAVPPAPAALHPYGAGVHPHDTLALSASVVTVGTFDGVHRGHQTLLKRIVARARAAGVASVVYTFDPPPKTVFAGVRQLTPVAEKIRRLSHFGIDHIVVARFDAAYAARPAEAFLQELARLNPLETWVGADFRFGRGRSGDVARLARCFDVRVVSDVACAGGDRISSTRVRSLLAAGREEEARHLHGWPREGCLPGTAG
ncbi:FAD synthetase family protein [Stappia sp.]|uniref:FAD synthetase family protein n=1 Tax=Stappia sp. TaxID=1870903 RepID=UPI0032D939D0